VAVWLEELLQKGVVHDYAELERSGAVALARIAQLMNLKNLGPPIIQERIFEQGRRPADTDAIDGIFSEADKRNLGLAGADPAI
jgi:hypothetical protein